MLTKATSQQKTRASPAVGARSTSSKPANFKTKTERICTEPEQELGQEAPAALAPARPRTPGGRLAMHRHTRKYRRAARLGCNGARWSTRSSTAATTGFVRGHRAPGTTNNRRLHRDSHHRCTRMCKRSSLPPATCVQVQTSLLKASTTNLTGPVATPAPCGVICLLQPAWIK
jgi:hypothetical protein